MSTQPEPAFFKNFADWCQNRDQLSDAAKVTIKALLWELETTDYEEAANILSRKTKLFLNFDGEQIMDLSPLQSLTHLRELTLYSDSVIDPSSLQSLTNLEDLSLRCQQVKNFSFLSALPNLTKLTITESPLLDLQQLRSLTQLTDLILNQCQIDDLSPLQTLTNLKSLTCFENCITDLSPLRSLVNLTELGLGRNQIADLQPLASLTHLTKLRLVENQITDLNPLRDLINLTEIHLDKNKIVDLSPLQSLQNLTWLTLNRNQIQDLSSLRSLIHLKRLSLEDNQITDLTALQTLTNLIDLHLGYNQIADLSPLQSLVNLRYLDLNHNQITDLSPLPALTQLEQLYLDHNPFTDLSPLQSLPHVYSLSVQGQAISTLGLLGSLKKPDGWETSEQKELTPEQIELLYTYRDQWLNIALSTQPITHTAAEAAVKALYIALERELPKQIVFVDSPRAAIQMVHQWGSMQEGYYLAGWSNWLPGKLAKTLDLDNLDDYSVDLRPVAPFLPASFWEAARHGIWRTGHYKSLWALSRLIWNNAFDSLEETQGHNIRQDIHDNTHSLFMGYELAPPDYLGIVLTDFLANFILLDYFESVLGCMPKLPHQRQWLETLKGLLHHCGWVFPFKNICIVCDRPTKILLDSDGRLQIGEEPVIQFADGWSIQQN